MLKIVVIDANAIARNLLTSLLSAAGHHVAGDTNTSPAGLARAIKLAPQLICIDIGEPSEHGLLLLDQLRSALPKTVLLLVSSSLESALVRAALERGVQGFIVKPFKSTTVLSVIRATVLKVARSQGGAQKATPSTDPRTDPEPA
ncbi:MAG: response regulator [Pseudomonadota bacterium]|nr:response regulator [Pseudomonadota bacterium]